MLAITARPLFSSSSFWLVCILSLCTTLLRETFNLWTPTYFTQVVGLSNSAGRQQQRALSLRRRRRRPPRWSPQRSPRPARSRPHSLRRPLPHRDHITLPGAGQGPRASLYRCGPCRSRRLPAHRPLLLPRGSDVAGLRRQAGLRNRLQAIIDGVGYPRRSPLRQQHGAHRRLVRVADDVGRPRGGRSLL